jgi:hypothetical protein
MTLELMEDWLGCVWEHWPGVLSKPQSIFTMDAFHGHISNRIRNRLRNITSDIVKTPSSMTSQLQPPDVSINKLFNHLVCKHYDAWLNKDNHILILGGKIRRAVSIMIEGISKDWKEVPDNIIPKTF